MLKGKKILVAEDDSYVREFIVSLLRDSGCLVFEAENGNEAINNYYNQEKIDCALIDLKMPEMDGTQFAAYNFENSFIPMVICTGKADSDTALDLLRYGVQYYLLKPFDENQLITTLSHVIGSGRIARKQRSDSSGFNWSVGEITIPSRRSEVYNACDWISKKLEKFFNKKDGERFVNFWFEFIFNAFEHGNLNISEERKSELLRNGTYEEEISRLEKECDKEINVELSVIRDEASVKILDQGQGFAFDTYLTMDVSDLVRRLEYPNGRGIYMGQSYFDEIRYEDEGRSVAVKKKFL